MKNFSKEDIDVIRDIMNSKSESINERLDSLILKTQEATPLERLYRGVCNTERRKLKHLTIGDIFQLNRPTSFTESIVCAEHFCSEVYHTGIIIELHTQNALCMNYYGYAVDYISSLPDEFFLSDNKNSRLDYYVMLADEKEQIFHSQTKLKIFDIETENNNEQQEITIYHCCIV